jgi:putative transposase
LPTTKAQRDAIVATRLTQVAQKHAEHGCRRLFEDYERDAIDGDEYMNYKRFRRIYRLAALQIGRRRRRGRAKIVRGRSLRRATHPFEGWTLDFIHDRLLCGRSFRGLTIMDEFSRCGLALDLNFSFPSRAVVAILDELARSYGYPKYLRVDNGTELTSKVMQQWSEEHDVELLFIQPGKPTQNAYIDRSIRACEPSFSTRTGFARCSRHDLLLRTVSIATIQPIPTALSAT